jgi:hypothetical protein
MIVDYPPDEQDDDTDPARWRPSPSGRRAKKVRVAIKDADRDLEPLVAPAPVPMPYLPLAVGPWVDLKATMVPAPECLPADQSPVNPIWFGRMMQRMTGELPLLKTRGANTRVVLTKPRNARRLLS